MMPVKLSEIRAKYPMYEGVSDAELLGALHRKFYSDIPRDKFLGAIDYDTSRIDPTADMSGTQKVLAGIGKGMTDLVRGAGQRLGLVSQSEIDSARANDAPLMKTGAGQVGNVLGKVAVGLPAAFVPGANSLTGAALIGGAQGALEPTAADESVLQNMLIGGAAGAGGVAAGRALKSGYQGAKALVEPFTAAGQQRIAGRVIERFATDPKALKAASSARTATGAAPTLAESTRDPGLAILERSLAQQDPQIAAQLGQRAAENNAARVGVLEGIAGTDATRTAAEAAREQAAGQMYKAATSATYTIDDKLANLLERPAIKQAMERAKTLAANQGRPFSFGVEAANPFSGMGVPTQTSKQITGQGLQDLKMALDEMLNDPASGFAGKAGGAVKGLRGQIVDWMERANPDFRAARMAYAEQSKPLNQMDVGRRLLDKTTAAVRDLGGNQKLQAKAFSRALNDEQSLVRSATGFKGVNALEDVMTPEQIGKIGAVRNELELIANLGNAANGPGSQTAKSLASQNLLRQVLGPTGLPQSWAEGTMLQTLMRPVQFGMAAAEPRIQNKLAEIMLNPDAAKKALKSVTPKEANKLLQLLAPYAQQAAQQSVPAAAVSR